MERTSHSHSVLAKLMSIDRQSPSHTSYERRKVLSGDYFQNIASVTHRKRSFLDLEEDNFMVVEGHLVNDDTKEWSENDCSCSTTVETHSRVRDKLEDVRFHPQISSGKTLDLSEAPMKKKLCQHVILEDDWYTSTTVSEELNKLGRKSCLDMKPSSLSRSLPFGKDRDRTICMNKGVNFQRKRTMTSLNDGAKSSMEKSSIAMQITTQVKNSVWHSFHKEALRSGSLSDKSCVTQHEESISSNSCLFSPENKHEAPCFDPTDLSASCETEKAKQLPSKKWGSEKFSHKLWTCCMSSKGLNSDHEMNDINSNTESASCVFDGCQGTAIRYLSKPMSYPSAWVPRSRIKPLKLDKNWDLILQKKDCFQTNDSISCDFGHEDSEKSCITVEGPSTIKHNSVHEEQDMSEDMSICSESFSNRSGFSCSENSTYKEDHMKVNENECKHWGEFVPNEDSIIGKTFTPVNDFQRDSNILEITEQLIDNATLEPRSPVSSLEGPEARSHQPNSTAETVSLESGSRGHDHDGKNEGVLVGCDHKDAHLMGIHGSSKNRDFCYLVDVLNVSGFHMKTEMYTSPEYALSPSVFNSLEKKYCKYTSWVRSDRRLLFDSINSVLLEVTHPFVGINIWRKPVVKRLGHTQDQDTIEKRIWDTLVIHEQELKKDPSDNVCRMETEWLELEEDIQMLVQELEFSLMNELIEEFVNEEIFDGLLV